MFQFHLLKLGQPDKVFFYIFREVVILYRLFLVDDEYGQLELMRRILLKMKEDLEVECFTRPLDALSAMQISPAQIIISDIRMPQMDGLTFIRKIRQEYPDTIIAILSAYQGKEEPAVQAMEQFLERNRTQKLSGSPAAAIQNFSHIMLVLHRQLGMEIPDAVFRELESCHSLQELCALLQDCIVKNLQRRRALNEQGTVRIIGEITQYIEENLEKDLTLNTIAQQFHFNPSYLSSLFKRQTGTGAERIYDPETDRTG